MVYETSNKYLIEIKDFLTVEAQNKLVKITKEYEDDYIEYDFLRAREECLIESMVVSVNNETDNILQRVLGINARDYLFIIKKIDDILERDKELLSKMESQYWALVRNGKGNVCPELSQIIICEKMHWTYETYLQQPSFFIEALKTKMHLDNQSQRSKIKHR